MKHVYQNEVDWYMAKSEDHAHELCKTCTGCSGCGEANNCCMVDEPNILAQCPDDAPMEIREDGGKDSPSYKRTYGKWAEHEPCGFLCSAES